PPVKDVASSIGSADATLRMIDHWDVSGPALVFPTDSIIDFELQPLSRAHLEHHPVVTVAVMTRAPVEVAGKYGVMLTAPDGRVVEFVEKPTLEELREYYSDVPPEDFDQLPLLTNAGFYLVDTGALRELAGEPEVAALRRERLDFGKDLLPWLVGKGHPVYAHTVRAVGDLGNVEDYLSTMVDALHGDFESVSGQLRPRFDPDPRGWIALEATAMRDRRRGK